MFSASFDKASNAVVVSVAPYEGPPINCKCPICEGNALLGNDNCSCGGSSVAASNNPVYCVGGDAVVVVAAAGGGDTRCAGGGGGGEDKADPMVGDVLRLCSEVPFCCCIICDANNKVPRPTPS